MQEATDWTEKYYNPKAVALVTRWMRLGDEFTLGNPEIGKGFRRMYEDESHCRMMRGLPGLGQICPNLSNGLFPVRRFKPACDTADHGGPFHCMERILAFHLGRLCTSFATAACLLDLIAMGWIAMKQQSLASRSVFEKYGRKSRREAFSG
jgi:hypothetical protein